MLDKGLKTLKGIGEKKAKSFSKLGIDSLFDLIEHYPKRYEDLSKPKRIETLVDGEGAVFLARVVSFENSRISGGKNLLKCRLEDDTGYISALYINAPYVSRLLKKGELYWFYGLVSIKGRNYSTFHPEFTPYSKKPEGFGIRPVYPLSSGINQSDIRNALRSCENLFSMVPEKLPDSVIEARSMLGKADALRAVHFPRTMTELEAGRNRLIFEEIFEVQLYLLALKKAAMMDTRTMVYSEMPLDDLLSAFPFELTGSQKKSIMEVQRDLYSKHPMNRLIFGDVGSGKTVIAIASALFALNSGFQVCVMAPTEILARQHFEVFTKLIPSQYKVGLLVSGVNDKKALLDGIRNGDYDVVVGTHAILQDGVEFKSLSLVITDEQHRFGVGQRTKLKDKSKVQADVLVMSATPIPRTLSLAFYGDLDISYVTDMPKGRKPIITKYVKDSEKRDLLKFIRNRILAGERVYFVAPRIEDSEDNNMVSVEKLYNALKRIYSKFNVELLHGKMSSEQKSGIMEGFKAGKIDIVVATSVIEVGIDVPEATIIVITDVDRFGLSQLHQLRGRVGRGDAQSYCFLTGGGSGEVAKRRIDAMVSETSGFKIAEIDLEIRGPGEVLGKRQHGFERFKIADYTRDYHLISEARDLASDYLDGLSESELKSYIKEMLQKTSWG